MIKTRFRFTLLLNEPEKPRAFQWFEKTVEMPYKVNMGDTLSVELPNEEGGYELVVEEESFDLSSLTLRVTLETLLIDPEKDYAIAVADFKAQGWTHADADEPSE